MAIDLSKDGLDEKKLYCAAMAPAMYITQDMGAIERFGISGIEPSWYTGRQRAGFSLQDPGLKFWKNGYH